MIRRIVAIGVALAAAVLVGAGPVTAHPLGNATVSRATAVTIAPGHLDVVHVIDMAEIPAYAAILELDLDGDGQIGTDEGMAWASEACEDARVTLSVTADDQSVSLVASAPSELTFPPGVGGLETLRLVCTFSAALPSLDGEHAVTVADTADDGRGGWREVTIDALAGVSLSATDVPAVSPSALLTAYPEDLLEAPINVKTGSATYRSTTTTASPSVPRDATAGSKGGSTGGPTDALVDLLDRGAAPWSWLVAAAIAVGLGAAHAVSPGHGKALIAAYVIGSRGSMRRAAGLGLTVAGSHTIGVFVLGAIVLSATELLVPDRVVAWLSVASGILVVAVGATVARRAWLGRREARGHAHPHDHPHDDAHHHTHSDGPPQPASRELRTLGLVGGMVPSTSALLVLLVAVATGRLVEGLLLILAFGAGMAVVLGGLAALTAVARNGLGDAARRPGASGMRRLAAAAPLASALVIIVVGVATTVGALGSL